jgi:competence protein ComEA
MLNVTAQERSALIVTALLLAAGTGYRALKLDAPASEWHKEGAAATDTPGVALRDSTRRAAEEALARARIRNTPLTDGERIDPNTASADELARLPRVGPALASRIVEWRTRHGPFRSLADIDQVPGIGPALLAGITPHLALPATGPPRAGGAAADRVDVNRAGVDELRTLPGVGPVLAQRIVDWRAANGPFRTIEDLERVPGIGPALRERLRPRISPM